MFYQIYLNITFVCLLIWITNHSIIVNYILYYLIIYLYVYILLTKIILTWQYTQKHILHNTIQLHAYIYICVHVIHLIPSNDIPSTDHIMSNLRHMLYYVSKWMCASCDLWHWSVNGSSLKCNLHKYKPIAHGMEYETHHRRSHQKKNKESQSQRVKESRREKPNEKENRRCNHQPINYGTRWKWPVVNQPRQTLMSFWIRVTMVCACGHGVWPDWPSQQGHLSNSSSYPKACLIFPPDECSASEVAGCWTVTEKENGMRQDAVQVRWTHEVDHMTTPYPKAYQFKY